MGRKTKNEEINEFLENQAVYIDKNGVFYNHEEYDKNVSFIQRKTAREILDVMYDVFVYNHKDVLLYMNELEKKIKERYDIKDGK